MIPGVVADAGVLGEGGGGGPASIGDLDFINETYTLNGSPVAIGDIIDTPSRVVGGGLEIPQFDTPTEMLGDLLTIMLTANWTIILDVTVSTLVSAVWLMSLCKTPVNGSNGTMQLGIETTDNLFVYDDAGPGAARNVDWGNITLGAHRIAIAREDARLSISVDGSVAVTGSGSISLSGLTNATFGNFTGDVNFRQAFIRAMTIIDEPASDEDLPSLSS